MLGTLFWIWVIPVFTGISSGYLMYQLFKEITFDRFCGLCVLSFIPILGYIILFTLTMWLLMCERFDFKDSTQLGKFFKEH